MKAPRIDDFLDASLELRKGGADADFDVPGAARGYLEAGRDYLRELHASGVGGRAVNEAHSDVVDRLLRRLFQLSEECYFGEGGEGVTELCVVAVGGYARREMSIHSDVDILFLYRDKLTPHVQAVVERMQYWLWDSQVTVGGATRSLAETLQIGQKDHSVATSILAPRFLAGSGVLFHQFNVLLRSKLLPKPERFLSELIVALQERHSNFGDTLYLLQPNVKEGAGGLRDYHSAYWAMQATESSARSKNDFLHLGLLTEEEATEYFEALDFLWWVRNEMHLVFGRKNDQMSFELQEQIAGSFGYVESEEHHELPVERFMGEYYRHARNVRNYSSLLTEQSFARVRKQPRRRRVQQVEDGLRIAEGQLEIPQARQLREDPLLLINAFAVAQDHDVPLTRKAQRLIRNHLHLIDDAYRTNPEAIEAFLRVLRSERRVTRSLIAMNEMGLLGQFLPEWEHIVCRWQHVMYHTYTVDVHSIFLVEELRRLSKGDYRDELPDLTEFIASFDDLTTVYLGCLFHDIGKGLGGNHSPKGAVRTRVCLERMGLDAELVDRVVFLVAEHLTMSHLAQRRDLSDPRLIREFAELVGDRANLRNLYLVAVADIRASSKQAWSDWKGRLLRELYEKTSEFLETNDPDRAVEIVESRVETRLEAARTDLVKQGFADEMVASYFEMMPRRYFMAHSPSQISRHAKVMFELGEDGSFAFGVRSFRGGFSEVIVCARDVHGLFANLAGILTAHHINILGAHVYTTRSGLALEVYRVSTPEGADSSDAIEWKELQESMRAVLTDRTSVDELLQRRGKPIGFPKAPVRQPETVAVTNRESDFYTIVDVAASDRLGLLHDLTRVIRDHGFEIYISKAALVLDQVTDTFYLKDAEGRKLPDAALEPLQQDLLVAAQGSDDSDG
jgi:[protein-PII] uridylyltransferase